MLFGSRALTGYYGTAFRIYELVFKISWWVHCRATFIFLILLKWATGMSLPVVALLY